MHSTSPGGHLCIGKAVSQCWARGAASSNKPVVDFVIVNNLHIYLGREANPGDQATLDCVSLFKPNNMSEPAQAGARDRNVSIQEWIDGSVIRSSFKQGANTGFVESLYRSCLDVFQEVWSDIATLPQLKSPDRTVLKEALARFYLWMPISENESLDSALERAYQHDLKTEILSLLGDIGKTLVYSE